MGSFPVVVSGTPVNRTKLFGIICVEDSGYIVPVFDEGKVVGIEYFDLDSFNNVSRSLMNGQFRMRLTREAGKNLLIARKFSSLNKSEPLEEIRCEFNGDSVNYRGTSRISVRSISNAPVTLIPLLGDFNKRPDNQPDNVMLVYRSFNDRVTAHAFPLKEGFQEEVEDGVYVSVTSNRKWKRGDPLALNITVTEDGEEMVDADYSLRGGRSRQKLVMHGG